MKILVLLILGVAFCTAADSNTLEESEEFNNVILDPLDSGYYGLTEKEDKDQAGLGQDDNDDDNEPLGDIEDALDEVLDTINEGEDDVVVEETEEAVLEEEDDNEGDINEEENDPVSGRRRSRWNKKRKQKMWKKHRKMGRKVSHFMKKKNIDDMSEVPKRMFKGPLRRMHKLAMKKGQNDDVEQKRPLMKGPIKKIYRKITKRVHKKLNKENNIGNKLKGICAKISQRTEPRHGVMKNLPHSLKNEFLSMFQKRREQLLQCCKKEAEAKKSCFIQAHKEKLNNICILVEQNKHSNETSKIISHWQQKTHCCNSSDDESKHQCFRKAGKAIRKAKWQKKINPQARLNHMCRAVQKPMKRQHFKKWFSQMNEEETVNWRQVFEERRRQMSLCCQKENNEEKIACVTELRRQRFERVCAGEEELKPQPKIKAKHDILVDTCCQKEDVDRLNCFTDRRFLKKKFAQEQPAEKQDDDDNAVVKMEIDIVEEEIGDDDDDDMNEGIADMTNNYDADSDEALDDFDYDAYDNETPLMDRMMGDAPMPEETESQNEDSDKPVRGRRQRRKNKRLQVRQTRQECCTAGRQAAAELPGDGKAKARRNQECEFKSQAFVAERELYKNFCTKIFQRCCGRDEGDISEDRPRTAAQKARKQQRKAERKRNRQERRRRVNVEIEVDGDVNEGMQEAEDIMEDIVEKVQF